MKIRDPPEQDRVKKWRLKAAIETMAKRPSYGEVKLLLCILGQHRSVKLRTATTKLMRYHTTYFLSIVETTYLSRFLPATGKTPGFRLRKNRNKKAPGGCPGTD